MGAAVDVDRAGAKLDSRRDRIIESAYKVFGQQGFSVGVRTVAQEAGVSPALVLHHFGSKQGLREAVEASLLDRFQSALSKTFDALNGEDLPTAAIGVGFAELTSDPMLRAYLRQSLVSDSEAARRRLGQVVALTHLHLTRLQALGRVRPGADVWWASLQVVFLMLGPVVFGHLLTGSFPYELYDDESVRARSSANFDLLMHGLFEAPTG